MPVGDTAASPGAPPTARSARSSGGAAAGSDDTAGAQIDQAVSEMRVRHSFTSNMPTETLRYHKSIQTLEDRVGNRICSRIYEMCTMRTVFATDIRKSGGATQGRS